MLPITPYSCIKLWYRRRDLNSHQMRFKRIVSANCTTSVNSKNGSEYRLQAVTIFKRPPGGGTQNLQNFGGRYRNRTCVDGFAIHRLFPLGQATGKIRRRKVRSKDSSQHFTVNFIYCELRTFLLRTAFWYGWKELNLQPLVSKTSASSCCATAAE